MDLYKHQFDNPRADAQANLMGRTHYVDDATLKWHRCKVLSTHVTDGGLLYAIVTADAADWQNTSRHFRFTVFDLFGTVVETCRTDGVSGGFKTSTRARREMWAALNKLDAYEITRQGIIRACACHATEMRRLGETVDQLEIMRNAFPKADKEAIADYAP